MLLVLLVFLLTSVVILGTVVGTDTDTERVFELTPVATIVKGNVNVKTSTNRPTDLPRKLIYKLLCLSVSSRFICFLFVLCFVFLIVAEARAPPFEDK